MTATSPRTEHATVEQFVTSEELMTVTANGLVGEVLCPPPGEGWEIVYGLTQGNGRAGEMAAVLWRRVVPPPVDADVDNQVQ